jgi:hypothetical protein
LTRLSADARWGDAPGRRDSLSTRASHLAEGLLKRRPLLQLLNLVRNVLDQLLKLPELGRDCLKQLLKLLMLLMLRVLQLLQLLRHGLQQLNCLLQGLREAGILRPLRSLSTEERLAIRVELLRITEWRTDSKCSSNHVNSFRGLKRVE